MHSMIIVIFMYTLCLSCTLGRETAAAGKTPFEEFNTVLMLDDIQVGYFSSKEQKLVPRGKMNTEITADPTDQKNAITVFTTMHEHMIIQAHNLIYNFNLTDGIQIHQVISGCDTLGRVINKEAFNGESGDEFFFNVHQNTLHTDFRWPVAWHDMLSKHNQWLIASFYQPLCINALTKFLNNNKKRIMKKVKPRVRLIQKALVDSGGAQLTCLATGFYPRHINLTLLRDGQPVSDHLMTGGEALPNGDETYQMRKSVEMSSEELSEHHYTCTATHLSLDNKLSVDLDPAPDTLRVLMVLLAVFIVLGAIVSVTVFTLKWWRK
ncbi:class I histocompatibility antigen, B alpha chain-like isoform X2 [Brachyhypopomus gauderio]|uniref:class I histocompatibility antigen, B alpha chain-like isoform X2 n=1 Tax=Brachyhypopomus gauderio TaxID=698409 RepID=UPI004042C726